VLYLAETQRKSGFIGNGKAEFKLLACQRSEHDWSAVPGDEVIAAPDDAGYGADTLVLIELNSSRQVQRHQEAGRTLVNILQNFSGLSKKFKSQGEEIEQWKESLTYQSQALNRREMEIETRQDQIEQAEADLSKVEAQQQEVEQQKAEVEVLRAELKRKNDELEGAWAHLKGEIQRFEEQQADASGGMNDEQMYQIRSAIARLGEATTTTAAAAEEPLTESFELIAHYRNELAENQHILVQKRTEVAIGQEALTVRMETLAEARRSLSETETLLCATQATLQQQQSLLGAKQDQNQLLTEQLENQSTLHQQVYKLLNATDKVRLSKKVDVAVLEAMAIDELQALVLNLEKDLDKMSQFVHDQEEELKLQQEDIDAIQAKIESASEYDRLQLETEIAEEKDRHVMLNRTLVGQRRNLLEREEVLEQHRAVLLRRQGLASEGTGAAAELEPFLNEIDELRAKLGEQIQQVETQSAQIQADIDSLKQTRQQQQEAVEAQRLVVDEAVEGCTVQQQAIGQDQGQVTLYESLLPSIEERLSSFYGKLESLAQVMGQIREAESQQQSAIAQAQHIVNALGVAEPALV
jgi:chromosome segregation ATPase